MQIDIYIKTKINKRKQKQRTKKNEEKTVKTVQCVTKCEACVSQIIQIIHEFAVRIISEYPEALACREFAIKTL